MCDYPVLDGFLFDHGVPLSIPMTDAPNLKSRKAGIKAGSKAIQSQSRIGQDDGGEGSVASEGRIGKELNQSGRWLAYSRSWEMCGGPPSLAALGDADRQRRRTPGSSSNDWLRARCGADDGGVPVGGFHTARRISFGPALNRARGVSSEGVRALRDRAGLRLRLWLRLQTVSDSGLGNNIARASRIRLELMPKIA